VQKTMTGEVNETFRMECTDVAVRKAGIGK